MNRLESLLKKLPMEDRTLANAQCLDPLKWAKKFGPESAPRLAEDLIDAVGNENSKHLFCIGNGFSKYSMMYGKEL